MRVEPSSFIFKKLISKVVENVLIWNLENLENGHFLHEINDLNLENGQF